MAFSLHTREKLPKIHLYFMALKLPPTHAVFGCGVNTAGVCRLIHCGTLKCLPFTIILSAARRSNQDLDTSTGLTTGPKSTIQTCSIPVVGCDISSVKFQTQFGSVSLESRKSEPFFHLRSKNYILVLASSPIVLCVCVLFGSFS